MYQVLDNRIWFDEPKNSRSKCWYCHAMIVVGDLRATIKHKNRTEHYHLFCFKPFFPQFISAKNYVAKLDKFSKNIVEAWIANWNTQFKPSNSISISIKKHKKHLCKIKIQKLRMWIEVLKFLPGIEVIKNISRVSRMFYELSWNQELFKYFCQTEFSSKIEFKCFRSLYQETYTEACYSCKSLNPNIKYTRFYHTQRNLCQKCDCKLLTKGDIKDKYNSNPNRLGLKFIRMKYNRKCVESYWVDRAIVNRNKKRKEKIFLHCKQNKKFSWLYEKIKVFDQCELKNFDKDELTLKQLAGDSENFEFLVKGLRYIFAVKKNLTLKELFNCF